MPHIQHPKPMHSGPYLNYFMIDVLESDTKYVDYLKSTYHTKRLD